MHDRNTDLVYLLLVKSVFSFKQPFKEYHSFYTTQFAEYEKLFDVAERWFAEMELEKHQNLLHYIQYFEKDEEASEAVPKDAIILSFEEEFEQWMRDIRHMIRTQEWRF